ncbi:MAG TPA: CDP-alcohol phosphatidyltransferase family protein [Archaeoglobus profundus]|nr:CDP-alcohol phosphatidyltransferase family protein [Archaeoglobus profundus]
MLSRVKGLIIKVLLPLLDILAKFNIKPNHLTFLGLTSGFFAAYLIVKGELVVGAIFIIISGFMDVLDGALARAKGMVSELGAFLDSISDRYADIVIYIALGLSGVDWFLIALAMSGSLMVSYTRARAENITERCDVGIAERGERLIIIAIGLITGYVWHAILIIAILSHITAIHRIIYTYKKVKIN